MKDKLDKKINRQRSKAITDIISAAVVVLMVFVAGLTSSFGIPAGISAEVPLSELNNQQQQREVSGVVTDQNTGETLPGVSVFIRGTNIGTVTGIDGRYSINITDPDQVLVFSFVGYAQQSVVVGDRRNIDIEMAVSAVDLDEIVVIGYGTQRRGDITGSVSSVSREEFRAGSVRDAAHLIQGITPGLNVGVTSGDPTAGTTVSLRGISSLLGDAEPLVIIDGVPGDLKSVAPEDIESINILKDGAAAAIYGTRGNDGVILITTRTAERGVFGIEYNTYLGTQEASRTLDFLTAAEMRQKINEGYGFYDYGYATDWHQAISRDFPLQHNHHLFAQGSTGESDYTLSVSYKDWEGLYINSNNEELRMRVNLNHTMFEDRLRLNVNMTTNRQNHNAGTDWGGSFRDYTFADALLFNPTARVTDDQGNWEEDPEGYGPNPVGILSESIGDASIRDMRLSGSLNFQPFEGLNMNLLLSNNIRRSSYTHERTFNHHSTVVGGENGYAAQGNNNRETLLMEFTTNYEFSIEDHKFTVLGGYSWQETVWESVHVNNWRFPLDLPLPQNIGLGDAHSAGQSRLQSSKSMSRLIGFFGRANYNYDNRYMVMASVRREGSSRFGSDHQWGTFPSVSAGWRISQEQFFRDAAYSDIFDNLMLRVGYGVTGIEPINPYLSLTMLDFSGRGFYEGQWMFGLEPSQNPNPDLRWEQQQEINIGLEFSLFNYRLGAEFDIYRRNTKDMLWNFAVPVPPYLYPDMLINIGELESKGFEAHIKLVPVRPRDFEWRTDIGYSTNESRLVALGTKDFEPERDFFYTGHEGHAQLRAGTHRVELGEKIGNFWTWKVVDIDSEGFWIVEDKDGNHIPFADATTDDHMVVGNGIPDYYINWNHQFSYRQFDLGLNMRGAFGFQVFNHTFMRVENSNITTHNVPRSTYDKVFGKAVMRDSPNFVSYYIEDGDYWKIDNITLGYNFRPGRIEFLSNARIYFSVHNALTITGYRGVDPEVRHTGLDPGKDSMGKYPTMRSFIIGANITIR